MFYGRFRPGNEKPIDEIWSNHLNLESVPFLMKKIRIGILADGGDAGGGRTHILTLCNDLPIEQFEIYFFSLGEGKLSHSVEQIQHVQSTIYPMRSKMDRHIFHSIKEWTQSNRIDILHTHGLKANMYGRLSLWRKPLPILTTYHSNPFFDYSHSILGFFFTLIDQWTIRRTNFYIAVSYEIATQLLRRGISKEKITIIRNGVPLLEAALPDVKKQNRNTIRAQMGIPQNAKVIGTLSRLVKVKGYGEMFRIFQSILAASQEKPYLLIIGGGEYRNYLEALAEKLGIDLYVKFSGFQAKPLPYLHASDLMLFTPRAEALGIAIIESMNSGTPVVAKKIGGIQELIIDQYNGFIKSSLQEIVESCLLLLEDTSLQEAFARNGRQMVGKYFTNTHMIQKTANLYHLVKKPVIPLLEIPVHNVRLDEALEMAKQWLTQKECHAVSTLNIEMLNLARQDSSLKRALQESDLVLPDGISIVKAGLLLGEYFSERIPGIEFSEGLLQILSGQNGKLFLLGGKPGVADKAAVYLKEKYPGVQIVGTHDGYFNRLEKEDIVKSITETKPDVLLVGLGMGKQETFIHSYKARSLAKIAIGVGGSFDVWSQTVSRAPAWYIEHNLEWLYRLLKEPNTRFARLMKTLPCFREIWQTRKRQYKKILISGYYGYGNIGDEAILESLHRDIREENDPRLIVTILSANPHATSTTTGLFAVHRFDPMAVLREVRYSDGIISGGGGLIQDITSWKSPLYYLAIIFFGWFFGKKVFVYANGVGPLRYSFNRLLTGIVFRLTYKITLRDEESKTLLAGLGVKKNVTTTIDPIFSLYQPIFPVVFSSQKKLFAVSIGPNSKTTSRLNELAAFLDNIGEKTGFTCLFTPFYPMYDRPFSAVIRKKMKQPSDLIETRLPPDEMFSILADCQFGIGMRLHFMIFMSLLNKPICPILYDKKVVTFADMLKLPHKLDLKDSLQDWNRIGESFISSREHNPDYTPITSMLSEIHAHNKADLHEFFSSLAVS